MTALLGPLLGRSISIVRSALHLDLLIETEVGLTTGIWKAWETTRNDSIDNIKYIQVRNALSTMLAKHFKRNELVADHLIPGGAMVFL